MSCVLPGGDGSRGGLSSTKEFPELSADHFGGDMAMTITALLVSVGVGTCRLRRGARQGAAGRDRRDGRGCRAPARGRGGGLFLDPAMPAAAWRGRRDGPRPMPRADSAWRSPARPGGGPEPGILWAYRPGSMVASRRVTRETLPPDWPVSMVLDAPARAEFLVRGPDGRPVAGARIRPRVLDRDFLCGARRPGRADRGPDGHRRPRPGRAHGVLPRGDLHRLRLGPRPGPPAIRLQPSAATRKPRTIDLMPVGRVEGRIVADDPEIARNRRLLVIDLGTNGRPAGVGARISRRPTDRGGSSIPEAPAGGLSVYGNPPAGSPWFL